MGRLAHIVLPVLTIIFFTGIIVAQDPTDATPKRVPEPPLIIDNPPKLLAFREKESFQMVCTASGDPEPNYDWEFNSKEFDPSGLDGRVNIQPGVGTLVFNSPLTRDEGLYQCFARNKYGVAASVKVVLRKGDLQAFPNTEPTRYKPELGYPLQLVCNPPVSYPDAEIMWTIVSKTESRPVEFDDRVSIDPRGNLNFANIIMADKADDQTYACEISNDVMRRQQRGSFYTIDPSGGVAKKRPPDIMWAGPTNQNALRGEIFRVKCIFSGNPTPRVTWVRGDDKPMPSRKTEESYGQEMVIHDTQFDDEGSYECEGINQEIQTPVTKSFKLTVNSAPYWKTRPISVSAAETDSASFTCEAEGRPTPVIAWFIDGKPISTITEDPRRKVDGGFITFQNLTIQDAMVFQCNASNVHGYIFANAFMNVQSEPPTILEGPKEQKAAEGQTIELKCKVYGSPKPLVVWSKGNEQLTGGNFKVLSNGSLQIEKVSLVDAGEYTCTATNQWDNATASGTLVVRRRTTIQTGPLDVMVYEKTEVKFTCTATTDPEEIDNLKIIWKRNGQRIDFSLAQRMFQNELDNSLTISGTISLDTSAYSCMATNGLDEDEVTAQLIVQGVPDAPEKIKVNCTENAKPPYAIIDWQPAKENYAPILNFIIQYNTTFAPDQWVTIRDDIAQNNRSIKIELSPWANYTFRVLARNKIGMSEPGIVSNTMCKTEPALPTKNPDNVIGEGDEPDNLVIFWTPMAPIDQNGKDFTYVLTWKLVGSDVLETYSIQGAPYYHHIVPGRRPTYAEYEITVKSNNEVGDGPVPTPTIGYSGEDAPTISVRGVAVVPDSLKGTEVIVEWPPIEATPDQIRGFFRGYRVQYWVEGGTSDSYREVDHIINKPDQYPRPRPKRSLRAETTTPIPVVRVRLNNLRPYSRIVLQVRILNKYYAGPPSDQLVIDTPEGEPGPPRSLEVVSKGPTHFDLQWEKPMQTNGILLGYNISYQTITGLNLGRLQYREIGVWANATSARLTALKPDMYYRVFLAAKTAAGKGEPMFMDARTSHAGAPNPPTFDFVGDVGETYVDIQWTPSRGNNPGSVFYVQYRERGEFPWHHTRDVAIDFSIRITDLNPGTTYQMRVVAKNGQGLESSAEWQEVTTAGIPPGGIDIGRSVWFYMMFLGLVVIALLMVGFIFCKRYRDTWWDDEERKREIELLAQMEKQRQLDMENQQSGSLQNMDPGVGYDSDEASGGESEEDFKKPFTPEEEVVPPLPPKMSTQGYTKPDAHLPPAVPAPMSAEPTAQAHPDYTQGYDYNQYPEGAYPEGAYPEGAYPEGAYPEGAYPEGTYPEGAYPEGAYPEGYYDGQYYPGYDGQYGGEYGQYPDGQYYDGQYPDGQYPDGQYYQDGQYPQYPPSQQDPQQTTSANVQGGNLYLDKDPRSGGSSAI